MLADGAVKRAAREHARRLFELLDMPEVDRTTLEAALDEHWRNARSDIATTLVHFDSLQEAVHIFFCGAENLADDEQYTLTGAAPTGLCTTLLLGVSNDEMAQAAYALQTAGRLTLLPPATADAPPRFRASTDAHTTLNDLVQGFFAFGEGSEVGYSRAQLAVLSLIHI